MRSILHQNRNNGILSVANQHRFNCRGPATQRDIKSKRYDSRPRGEDNLEAGSIKVSGRICSVCTETDREYRRYTVTLALRSLAH